MFLLDKYLYGRSRGGIKVQNAAFGACCGFLILSASFTSFTERVENPSKRHYNLLKDAVLKVLTERYFLFGI
ncbi:hypothetical protein ACFX13_012344 [Malus domestica]